MAFGMLSRHWSVWKAAWQAEKGSGTICAERPGGRSDKWFLTPSLPGLTPSLPGGRSTEFLPAVLEIQQAPPSPIGRAILWTILAVFTTGVLWATFGWIDIVATAQGKIIPSGYSKVIQPYETGVIAAIHVQNGQSVKRGDVLIELDSTLNRADRDRASNEYRAAKVEAARLRALIAGSPIFEAPPDGEPPYVLLQRQLLMDQLAEYQARAASAQHLIDQRKAGLDQTRENIRRLEATVPMEAERAEAYIRSSSTMRRSRRWISCKPRGSGSTKCRNWPGSARSSCKINPRSLKPKKTIGSSCLSSSKLNRRNSRRPRPRWRRWCRM